MLRRIAMRRIALLGFGYLLASATVVAGAPDAVLSHGGGTSAWLVGDTTTRLRFNIPAKALTQALADFSRQTGVRLEVNLGAAEGVPSQPLAGTHTAAEALRQLLVGTGLSARFVDLETALVTR